MTDTILIVGGGISGLFAAFLAQKRNPNKQVIVIEKADKVGGLLKSFDYGGGRVFDHGVHTFYETGIAEIDDFMQSVLPVDDWHFMERYERDLGGSWYNGTTQYDTPYIDLQSIMPSLRENYIASLFGNLNFDEPLISDESAINYAIRRYGENIAQNVIRPVIEARQGISADDVHWLAIKIQGLDRIKLLPSKSVEVLSEAPSFQGRIAFPNQRNYPAKYLSNKRSYYPAKFGLGSYIEKMVEALQNSGIEIYTSTSIEHFSYRHDKISEVRIRQNDNKFNDFKVDKVYWSVGMPALMASLDLSTQSYSFDRPDQTVICNLLVRNKPRCGGVYYIFFHGHERIHRVSFGYNYSRQPLNDNGYPISVELIYPGTVSVDNCALDVVKWLKEAGILEDKNEILFSAVEKFPGGYPKLSQKNITSIKSMRNEILNTKLQNLVPIGLLARENLFFQFDLMRHVHEVVQ